MFKVSGSTFASFKGVIMSDNMPCAGFSHKHMWSSSELSRLHGAAVGETGQQLKAVELDVVYLLKVYNA